MDCVECEKCKVYGKMQIAGVGTALKILFNTKQNGKVPPLRRNEFIVILLHNLDSKIINNKMNKSNNLINNRLF